MRGSALAVALVAVIATAPPAPAQLKIEDPSATATDVSVHTGCFELFLSPRQTRETYLINACTGETWFRIGTGDRTGWQAIPREDNPLNTETLSQVKHFQIVSSGLTAQDTFLLNRLNGATWQLFEGGDGLLFWGSMARATLAPTAPPAPGQGD